MIVGDFVWHSRRKEIPNATKATFDAPTKITTKYNYFTVMAARGYIQVMRYGEDLDNTWIAIANAKYFNGKIKEGDLLWIDGASPIEEIENKYGNGASANATVKSVAIGNHSMEITLQRNKNQKKR